MIRTPSRLELSVTHLLKSDDPTSVLQDTVIPGLGARTGVVARANGVACGPNVTFFAPLGLRMTRFH